VVDGTRDWAEPIVEFRKKLDGNISLFSHRRKRDKRKALVLRLSVVTLTAMTTVLLGLRVDASTQTVLANVALGLSAGATLLSGWDAFFNHRGLWISRTITTDALQSLARRLEFAQASGPLTAADVSRFFDDMETIVAADRERWLKLRSEATPSPNDLNPSSSRQASPTSASGGQATNS
jgi:hypothetical protein